MNSNAELVTNVSTRACILLTGAEGLILIIWLGICFVKQWDKHKLTMPLFILHLFMLLTSCILYSLFIRYTRPDSINCEPAYSHRLHVVSSYKSFSANHLIQTPSIITQFDKKSNQNWHKIMFEKEKKRSCNTFGVELICEKIIRRQNDYWSFGISNSFGTKQKPN